MKHRTERLNPQDPPPERHHSSRSHVGNRSATGRTAALSAWSAALALTLTATILGCSSETVVDAPTERVLEVRVAAAAASDSYSVSRSYVGQVEAKRRSQVGFDLPGTLVRAVVDEGDRVNAGATLARLDLDRLQARKRELTAALEQSRTASDLASSTLERIERAAQKNAVSAQDVDEATQRQASAEAALQRTQAQIDLIEVDLAKSVLRAPYAAIVSKRHIDEGQVLAAGTPVFELVERVNPRVRIGVGPDVARSIDRQTRFDIGVKDQTFSAQLLRALPEQNPTTRTVDLLFELDTTLDRLRIGETATLAFEKSVEESGFWLPVGALTESLRGLWSCYVAVPVEGGSEATHVLEKRQLETLEIGSSPESSSPRAYVRGALGAGDLVVTDGLQRLTAGQRVNIQKPTFESTQAAPDGQPAGALQ